MKTGKPYKAIPEYYDPENEGHRVLAQDVPFFLGQLPKRRQSILEIAAGTGRVAIPLAQAGHRVVGIDYDPEMLEIARRKRDAVGLGERELSLVRADAMRLKLNEKFDWVCILFNTFLGFTTLEEQDRVMESAAGHLKPRGRFWIDVFNPDFRMLSRPHATDLDPQVFYVPRYERSVTKTVEVRRGDGYQVQRIIFHYQWFDSTGRRRHERVEFDLTYLFPRELQLLVERHGLRIEQMWGNYNGTPVHAESPRIIARCCRA